MNRVEQTIPGITNQILALSLEQRRGVVAKAGQLVSRSISDLEPSLYECLQSAVADNALTPQQVADMRAYADAADERYFNLKELGADETDWRNWFAKARLATALVDAFGHTTCNKSADALYELCFVEEDDSAVVSLIQNEVMSALKRSS